MKTIAIIPARGGSKGIARKNVRILAGKPLLAYAIEAAVLSRLVDRVVVSTDDREIASVTEEYGGEVVWRPHELSSDKASSESALLHTLEFLKERDGYDPEITVFLQCTSPLTLGTDIDGAVQALLDANADSAFSANAFHYFIWREDEHGEAVAVNHKKETRPRRQDRQPEFRESGAIYVMRTEGLKSAKHRFFGKTVIFEMPGERVLEIDEPVDFQIAEMLIRERQRNSMVDQLPEKVEGVVLDFDGVFTDNRILINEQGVEAVFCDRSDDFAIRLLKELGIPLLVVSQEKNSVVGARCKKLGIEHLQVVDNMSGVLAEWMKGRSIAPSHVIYVGNYIKDVDSMRTVGCPVAVADAHPAVLSLARLILTSKGGNRALREIADLIQKKTEAVNRA